MASSSFIPQILKYLKSASSTFYFKEYFELEKPFYFSRLPIWKKAGQLVAFGVYFEVVLSLFVGILRSKNDIIHALELLMYLMIFIVAGYANYLVLWNRAFLVDIFDMLEKSHQSSNVFIKIYSSKFVQDASSLSLLLVKFLGGLVFVSLTSLVVIGTIMSAFMDQSSYPLPISTPLIGLELDSLQNYFISYIWNVFSLIVSFIGYFEIGSVGLVTFLYLLAFIDGTMEILKNTAEVLEDGSFEEYTRAIMELILLSREFLDRGATLMSGFFFMCQLLAYALFFSCWIIVNTDIRGIFHIVPGVSIMIGVFIVVVCNEAVIQKYKDLEFVVYDVLWYNMPAKDQKAFIIFLAVAQNPILVTAGGLHVLTYDWYSNLFKQAYNMALYIGDMLL